jgi:hypothetical protein
VAGTVYRIWHDFANISRWNFRRNQDYPADS